MEPPGGDPFREHLAVAYATSNRGKRSVVVDLQNEEGKRSLRRLLSAADVFVETGDPERRSAWGSTSAPSTVFIRRLCIARSAASGRSTDTGGYEAIVQARIGAMGEQVGYRPGPIFGGVPFCTFGAAYLAVIGTLAALYRRAIDGLGRGVETESARRCPRLSGHDVGRQRRRRSGAPHRPGREPPCRSHVRVPRRGVLGCAHRGDRRVWPSVEVLGLEGEVRSSETGASHG